MRALLTNNLHWFALGAGILVLVAGITASRSLFQPVQDTGSTTVANQVGPAASGNLPELSAGNPWKGDLADPDSSDVGQPLITGEDGAIDPLAVLNPIGIGPGMMAAEVVAMNDSADLEIKEDGPAPHQGGPGEVASFQDDAELVVRDSQGNIKRKVTVR